MYDFGIRRAISGYRVAYHPHEANHCPGCGNAHWLIGRLTAECAFCGTALPLHTGASMGQGALRNGRTTGQSPLAA